MKENIEEEKAINNMKMFARVHQDMTIVTAEDMDIVLNLIEKLQKENEELKSSNEKLERANKCYINSIHSIVPVLNQDYIEKQKIKDKIEELEAELKFEITEREARLQINLLKSLLEGEI